MARYYFTDILFSGGAKITGLPAATAAGQAVEYAQWLASVEGMAWKDDVRAASTANINLAAPGTTIDGITMVANDRFLAKDQTAGSENGIYIWNGAAVVATRAPDMSISAEFNAAVVPVLQGTANGGTQWRQSVANPTVGSTTITFGNFLTGAPDASETTKGILEIATQAETDTGTDDLRAVTPLKLKTASYLIRKYSTDVGDGSATSYTITHNLGTRDIQVYVRRNSGAYDRVEVDEGVTTTNTVTLVFPTAPSAAQFRVIIMA